MHGTPYEALVALILSVDKSVLVYLLPMDLFFSIAIVSMFSRGRRPLELLALFGICFALLLCVAWLVFDVGFGRPFFRLEVVSYP